MKLAYQRLNNSEALNEFVKEKFSENSFFREKFSNVKVVFSKEAEMYKASLSFVANGKRFKLVGKASNAYASVAKVFLKAKNAFPKKMNNKRRLHSKRPMFSELAS
ncbi:HPF/RaiA family ribosome-associated protein [Halobacteriovorax sp. HLS]|uniref:HPF/RaiA family ribosome-associated protein n=1 Tax=Halobacteriovorax sp. HLS TaxID=2234000 RepID=UPI000FDB49D6|nr:HPF/RaiA family ribosome-associated protein [Halobacteriovorax sp. HLS]